MYRRLGTLQKFVDAAHAAFEEFVVCPSGRRAANRVFQALEEPSPSSSSVGSRLPVCSQLPRALSIQTSHRSLRDLLDCFSALEPHLQWRGRPSSNDTASDNFPENHANAMIIGPSGVEDRRDVWVGASLLAPRVRYPDHNHPPEEVYLVVSDGEFRQDDGPWFTPGVGGTLYNSPGIRHAMRSSHTPLLAFWLLPVDSAG